MKIRQLALSCIAVCVAALIASSNAQGPKKEVKKDIQKMDLPQIACGVCEKAVAEAIRRVRTYLYITPFICYLLMYI